MTTIERTVVTAAYDAEFYRRDAHRVGMTETLNLIGQSRPGAALRRLARTVSEEMACLGYPGTAIPVTEGMTRVIHAKRVREARRAVTS